MQEFSLEFIMFLINKTWSRLKERINWYGDDDDDDDNDDDDDDDDGDDGDDDVEDTKWLKTKHGLNQPRIEIQINHHAKNISDGIF